ncbi:MAG: UDP-glucuronic acid decarboxylase family protein, partial [Pseudomonadota bacterium]|nr:UDP-glucuronic acid decarboxylase family protein [Pseudomonadota bacterium]
QHLITRADFDFIQHDVTVPLNIKIDEIYNLACPASPVQYQIDPIQTTKTGILGTLNMLDLAKSSSAKLLLASTSEIYGEPEVHPQPEEYWGKVNPLGQRACYNEAKRCAETLLLNYHRQHNTPVKIARIFNTYGPRMQPNDGRVISNFVTQALQNEPITIYGAGSQTRSFCYIDDMIAGLIRLMESPGEFTGPVNLGNPFEISIQELAEKIVLLTKSCSKIVTRDLPADDPTRRQPDITLARQTLDWQPTISLEEGLLRTIQYFYPLLNRAVTAENLYA